MARKIHGLKIKSGFRTISDDDHDVDPDDSKDLADCVKRVLKARHQSGATNVTVEIYNEKGRYLKQVKIQ